MGFNPFDDSGSGGGGTSILIDKTVNANGIYNATDDSADGYKKVVVDVPNTYVAADEGKVVSNGVLTAQTSVTKTINGTYDTTTNNEVIINVANSYTVSDEGKVVDNGALVAQTSSSTNANGTVDTTLINSLSVSVPNTYVAGDEGKVVNNGALVPQTTHAEITENGTYDTTLNNSVTVDVSSGGSVDAEAYLMTKSSGFTNRSYAYIVNATNETFVYGVLAASALKTTGTLTLTYPSTFTPVATTFSGGYLEFNDGNGTKYQLGSLSGTYTMDTTNHTVTIAFKTGCYFKTGDNLLCMKFKK